MFEVLDALEKNDQAKFLTAVVQLVESSIRSAVCRFTEGCGLMACSNCLALVVICGEPSFRMPLMYSVRLPMLESITYC